MFDLGELVSFDPITAGIENSNYFITLDNEGFETEYVLTISESLDFNEVSFFGRLLDQLSNKHLPVPSPLRTLDGMSSTIFCKKPTWLFPKLSGSHPTVAQQYIAGLLVSSSQIFMPHRPTQAITAPTPFIPIGRNKRCNRSKASYIKTITPCLRQLSKIIKMRLKTRSTFRAVSSMVICLWTTRCSKETGLPVSSTSTTPVKTILFRMLRSRYSSGVRIPVAASMRN